MKVAIYGPNLGSPGQHAHASGCADERRAIYIRDGAPFIVEATTRREVVEACYPPDDFLYDGDAEWEFYAGDIKFFPCLTSLA